LSEYAFNDPQKKYYILIDKLDEDWAETETRCRFIRALIEETKSMRRIPQVKIITALRRDLLDLVFDKTRDSGFQEEKYDAYIVRLSWSKEDLKKLLNSRICEVYRRQYTSEDVNFSDVFPAAEKHKTGPAIDYIINRTLFRPRDAIQFSNECFAIAADRPKISWRAIFAAESNYSNKRLKSLNEEWYENYPALSTTIEAIRGLSTPFTRSSITSNRITDVSTELHDLNVSDVCVQKSKELYAAGYGVSEADFVSQILMCLYHVGVIGIKISTLDTYIWSNIDQPVISKSEIKRANQIKVHKMLHHSLEIKEKEDRRNPSKIFC